MKQKLIKKKKKFKLKFRKESKKISVSNIIEKLLTIIILIILYKYLYPFEDNKIPLEQYQSSVLPEIKSFEKNLHLNKKIFNEFREINSENKLIEENPKFERSNAPDISIIMTIYNQAHCLHKGLRSVQNQSIKNIEIIIVDDCSLDNSIELIKEYQKEDPRIILISHDSNEGTMKSRTDGIKRAKGKFLTMVDGDDALIHKDILKNSLFIIQKAKLDVVQFPGVLMSGGKSRQVVYYYPKQNVSNIIYQPELRTKFVEKIKHENNFLIVNRLIWGKLIKKELFQKILIYLGSDLTNEYITEIEDTLLIIGAFHLAKSYYIMKELGYYYSKDEKKDGFNKTYNKICKANNKIKNFGWYLYYKFLVNKFSKNDKEKFMIISEMKIPNPIKEIKVKLDKKHYQILFYIYDKMLEWNCWNKEQRDYIIAQKNKAISLGNKDNIN